MTRALLCVGLLALALPRAADASPDSERTERAAELYAVGKRQFDIAEYPAAIAAWKESYLLSNEPLLLFNIAQAHRLAGDCAQANRFYLNYKRAVPKPANQAELDTAMAKCAGVQPAGDTTPVVSPIVPPAPAPDAPAPVQPPTPPAPVVTTPPPMDAPDTHPGRTLRIAGIVVASAGGLASVVAVVSAFTARSDANDVSGQNRGTEWGDALARTERDGQSAQTRARVFGVLGVAAIVTGGVLWWRGRQAGVNLDVAITPNQTALGLSCAF